MDYNLYPVDLTHPLAPISGTPIVLHSNMIASGHSGTNLFIAGHNNKCYTYSLANPMLPLLKDSVAFPISSIRISGNTLYSISPSGNKIYSWAINTSAPYLSLTDSTFIPAFSYIASIDITGSQLLLKNGTDSLYRFRITATGLSPISVEKIPEYPFNGSLVALDSNILGYTRYNTFYASNGTTGNSFIDSVQIPVDGNYAVTSGLLDNHLYYTNVSHTYLVGFNEHTSGVGNIPNEVKTQIFPNPARQIIYLTVDHPRVYTLSIYSIDGQLKMKYPINQQTQQINIESLPVGIYILRLCDEQMKQMMVKELVKQ